MVRASTSVPVREDGTVDTACWEERVAADLATDVSLVSQALQLVEKLPHRAQEFLSKGMELAELVLSLNMDAQSVAAALLYRPVRTGELSVADVRERVSAPVAELVGAVVELADTSLLEMSNARMQISESRDQVENIRRMLVSMVDDARVAVLKLAERVVALRAAKNGSEERKQRIAQEAHQVFAPLANRLGVWQLKWELEDLALRYLAPDIYKTIAGQLDGRRAEREEEIRDIVRNMETELRTRGIDAQVSGRAKHIFSIWRKMRAKNVGLQEVYDVRAIRVLVPDIAQCYSALGVIHTHWQHVPSEFDDYIAVPKENGYRSIHTAVSWSDGKTLEVQIRTPEMHEQAELGVCAHWAYKDGGAEDEVYARKMDWMRQVMEWQEETEERIRHHQIGIEPVEGVREERIFVYTPKGHVLDLTTGATALDFAYRVHTEVGHRALGARVDGKSVPLNQPLASGQRVEVITSDHQCPQRVWLHQHLECIRTARAREKISDWFRNRRASENESEGRELLARSFERIKVSRPAQGELSRAAGNLGFSSLSECLIALGAGDCQILDLLGELLPDEPGIPPLAGPPAQLSLLEERDTGARTDHLASYSIEVLAEDRSGLLMDVTAFLGSHGIMLVSNRGRVLPDGTQAVIEIEVRLSGLPELLALMDALEMIPGVLQARRTD